MLTSLRPAVPLLSRLALLTLTAATVACHDGSDPEPGADRDPGGGEQRCLAGDGTGTLTVTVTGMPGDSTPSVTVLGADRAHEVTSTTSLELAAGWYQIAADPIVVDDPTVRTVHRPAAINVDATCLRPDTVVDVVVEYQRVATSGALWTWGSLGQKVIGFRVGPPQPSYPTVAETAIGRTDAHTFDADGNLWLLGATSGDPTLRRYPAWSVPAADAVADIEIEIADSSCAPGPSALAFDRGGDLWIAIECRDAIVRIAAADLTRSGTIAPSVVLSGIDAPLGLAFDAGGNLWVAAGEVHRYDAARLTASTATADATLILAAGAERPRKARAIAFDAGGALWATIDVGVNFVRLDPPMLVAAGRRDVTPAAAISVGVYALPHGIAFDDSGNLWFAGARGVLGMLTPGQQVASSSHAAPTLPTRTVTDESLGHGRDIVFYPAAAGLPLYHRLP